MDLKMIKMYQLLQSHKVNQCSDSVCCCLLFTLLTESPVDTPKDTTP